MRHISKYAQLSRMQNDSGGKALSGTARSLKVTFRYREDNSPCDKQFVAPNCFKKSLSEKRILVRSTCIPVESPQVTELLSTTLDRNAHTKDAFQSPAVDNHSSSRKYFTNRVDAQPFEKITK